MLIVRISFKILGYATILKIPKYRLIRKAVAETNCSGNNNISPIIKIYSDCFNAGILECLTIKNNAIITKGIRIRIEFNKLIGDEMLMTYCEYLSSIYPAELSQLMATGINAVKKENRSIRGKFLYSVFSR